MREMGNCRYQRLHIEVNALWGYFNITGVRTGNPGTGSITLHAVQIRERLRDTLPYNLDNFGTNSRCPIGPYLLIADELEETLLISFVPVGKSAGLRMQDKDLVGLDNRIRPKEGQQAASTALFSSGVPASRLPAANFGRPGRAMNSMKRPPRSNIIMPTGLGPSGCVVSSP
jgi:hypothetical protein